MAFDSGNRFNSFLNSSRIESRGMKSNEFRRTNRMNKSMIENLSLVDELKGHEGWVVGLKAIERD